MKTLPNLILFLALLILNSACGPGNKNDKEESAKQELVKEYRDDGTLSSVRQVDSEGYVHGIKVNYYEDGKTVHSKVTYDHGRKHGAAEWYFKNGTVGERTSYHYGRKEGITRRYYKTGKLREEIEYVQGTEVPGSKKEYDSTGKLIQ